MSLATLDAPIAHGEPDSAQDSAVLEGAWSIVRRAITRKAREISEDRDDQADLVQEALIRLWEMEPSRFDFGDREDLRFVVRLLRNRMWDVAWSGKLRREAPKRVR